MQIAALKQNLSQRRREVESELSRLSAIYNTKSSVREAKPSNPINPPVSLSQEDRLKMLAMENERLRALVKSIANSAEKELGILEALSAELQVKEADQGENFQVAELNGLLTRQLQQKDEEIAVFRLKLEKLKAEMQKKPASDELERIYKERFNSQVQTIKMLENENAVLKLDLQQMGLSFRGNPVKNEPIGFGSSQNGQKDERIYEELNCIRSELANMTKLQSSSVIVGGNANPTEERFKDFGRSSAYYKEKQQKIKKELSELQAQIAVEKKRTELAENSLGQTRAEKSLLAEKLAKCKAKLKQLRQSPESKLLEGHLRGLELQLAGKKEESERLALEKTALAAQADDLKTQLAARSAQVEQLNSTLLKFASNFRPNEPTPATNQTSQQKLASETPNPKLRLSQRANPFRSVYKNFARIDEMDEPEPHFDLSLNIPPDIEALEHENLGHFNKLKHVVRELNEKQQTHLKNLELKTEKITELKKSVKSLKKELEELRKENSGLKNSVSSAESRQKRLEDELDKLTQERKLLRSDLEEAKEKLGRAEERAERFARLERENRKAEKESEYFQKVSEQKSVEIEALLRTLREREDYVRQVVGRSQHLDPAAEEQSIILAKSNKKLKKFLKRLQEDFFRLEEENSALKEAVEREIDLREQIVEEFAGKAAGFEAKVELFGEFQKNLEDFKKFFASGEA